MNSKPRGRAAVWLGVLAVALVVLITLVARPRQSGQPSGDDHVRLGATQSDIAASQVPGTADRQGANRPVATESGG